MDCDTVCSNLVKAAEEAKETQDYLSYATLVDVSLLNGVEYPEEDKIKLLTTLSNVLKQDEQLLSNIAWSIIDVLLNYLHSSNFNSFDEESSFHGDTGKSKALYIFSQLGAGGNPKEVLLESLNILSRLEIDPSRIVYNKDLTIYPTDYEKTFSSKFAALYALSLGVLKRIHSQYPSRFVSMITTSFLSFAARAITTVSYMSVYVIGKRLYLFARDCNIPKPPVNSSFDSISEHEMEITRALFSSYNTYLTEIVFRHFSVQWTVRLFNQVKYDFPCLPARMHSLKISLNTSSSHFIDFSLRLYQNTLSNDKSPLKLYDWLVHLAKERNLSDDFLKFEKKAESFGLDSLEISQESDDDEDEEDSNGKDDNECKNSDEEDDSNDDEIPKNASDIHLSEFGVLYNLTELLCSDPNDVKFTVKLDDLILITKYFLYRPDEEIGIGTSDAIFAFSLWYTAHASHEEIEEVSKPEFKKFLKLLAVKSLSSYPLASLIVHFIVAKLLRLSSPEFAYGFIMEMLKYDASEKQFTCVLGLLKDFIIKTPYVSRKNFTDPNDTEKKPLICYAPPFINLSESQISELNSLALEAIQISEETTTLNNNYFGFLLNWINFYYVTKVDPTFFKLFKQRLDHVLLKMNKELQSYKLESENENKEDEEENETEKENNLNKVKYNEILKRVNLLSNVLRHITV